MIQKQNRFETLNAALASEGLLETWDISYREILHGRTFSYTYEYGSKYGYYVSVHRFEDGSYERPISYTLTAIIKMPYLSYDSTPYDYHTNDNQSQIIHLSEDKARLEAGLCAVMTYIERIGIVGDFVSSTDWEEAGITPVQLRSWWEDHKEKDKRRRALEAKIKSEKEKHEKKIANLQSKTWSELTADEIKILLNNTKK